MEEHERFKLNLFVVIFISSDDQTFLANIIDAVQESAAFAFGALKV